ncbi:MAG TPA: hypothetical protein VMT46_12125 [Anaerolineaceae bacterium]|nr:hypothetical protein [Anaerolineaceae bacterium]
MNLSSRKRLSVLLVGLVTLLGLGIAYLVGAPEVVLAVITILGLAVAVLVVLVNNRIG